jgi:hypothetical protein
MEHRWGTRIPLGFPAQIEMQGRRVAEGEVHDASISGALIHTAVKLPMLSPVVVTIQATVAKRTYTLRLPASVVRVEPGAIAVEWRDMASPPLVDALQAASSDGLLWARDGAFG